jgi:hypothetical protein
MSDLRGPLGGRPSEICAACRWLITEHEVWEAGSCKRNYCVVNDRTVAPDDFCVSWEAAA